MNEKEVSEIRRRFKPDKSNIASVRGCYVNEKGEIVAEFNQSLQLIPEEEAERFLAILKRTLSGTLNKNLFDIAFSTKQVIQSDEHQLLMELRDSQLKNEEAVQALFQRVIQSVTLEGNYLILLAYDSYDIPYRSSDDLRQDDASSEVFSYITCSVCPVKMTKPALSYYIYENEFHSRAADWLVSPPELGFMFPAFDDRSTNIYGALYYTKDIADNHAEFADALFSSPLPMPAAEQKETFQSILTSALADECDYETVQSVNQSLQEMIEEHKASKEPVPLTLSRGAVRQVLSSNGVSGEHVAAFEAQYDERFGADSSLSPHNLIDTRKMEVTTPDVTIRVSTERSDLVETRVINGTKYILIRADEGVELNGVPIHIS